MEKVRTGTYQNMEKSIKINLGCGYDYRNGYINVDNQKMFPDAKVDVISDIKEFDVEDGTVKEILLSHVVMYFRPEELHPLLLKLHGWLKEGGRLVIETIDLKKVMQTALNESNPITVHNYGLVNIFGTEQTGPHKWGWMPDRLAIALYKAGFNLLQHRTGVKKPNRDYQITAIK